ncbi:ammonium transporter, partial [Campylobacter fetus subsp. venerealis]
DQMGVTSSIIIGLIGGGLIVVAVVFFDKIKVDDPVGAISVHLVGGIWGTLAVGIFGDLASLSQFFSQLIGVAAVGLFCVI